MKTMHITGRTQMMSQYSVYEALGRMKELGFGGAEICLEAMNFTPRPELLEDYVIAKIRERITDLDLKGMSFSYHSNYISNDDAFALTKKAIKTTRAFGTNLFVFSGRRADKTAPAKDQWRQMVERTRELCAVAEDNGVILAKEPEPGFICGTSEEFIALTQEIPSPALCCNLDLGHAFLCDRDPFQSIRQLNNRIVHCHIENMKRGVHDHRLPDDGDMDLPAYIAALQSVHFSGPLAFDMYGYDYEAVSPGVIGYFKGLI